MARTKKLKMTSVEGRGKDAVAVVIDEARTIADDAVVVDATVDECCHQLLMVKSTKMKRRQHLEAAEKPTRVLGSDVGGRGGGKE